jgi:hypothetical protein
MKSYSQAGQDLFVNAILKKNNGFFIEIGAYHHSELSNSLMLEELGWDGICIDIDESLKGSFKKNRKCKFVGQDATLINYDTLLPCGDIDYISFDVDRFTLDVLKVFPLKQHPASVITYEHDAYGHGNEHRDESRRILLSLGYVLLCSDVKHNGNTFEDWYYNPSKITLSEEFIKRVSCDNQEYTNIIKNL